MLLEEKESTCRVDPESQPEYFQLHVWLLAEVDLVIWGPTQAYVVCYSRHFSPNWEREWMSVLIFLNENDDEKHLSMKLLSQQK